MAYAGPLGRRRVLDLACGTGLSTIGLAKRGLAVTGVDIASNMLAAARQRDIPRATFWEGRAEQLPFPDACFGLVTCGQAFHWFDAPIVGARAQHVPDSGLAALARRVAIERSCRTAAACIRRDAAVHVESFVGYESSRETLRMALGDRRAAYLEELRAVIGAMAPDGSFEVRAKEYCFLARRRRRP